MPAPASVLYRRDLLGRLVAAGTADDPKAHGAWSWRGDGALATETLEAGAAAVTRSFAYDGLGRPVSVDEPALTQTISYRRDGDPAKPQADGGISAETVTYKPAAFPAGAVPPSSTTTYAYDAFGRLTGATAQRASQAVAAAYDANGNLDSLAQAGQSRSYAYQAGTSRLASVAGQAYEHDAAGAVTLAAGTALVRDPATGRMRRGSKAGQTVSVLRDGRGRIALTVQGSAKRLSLRDGQGAILVEREGTSLAALHLHGATGRIGLWTGDQLYAVSKDLRGSTRILYGSDGKAAAWLSYCAYGVLDTEASSSEAALAPIRNRYTGQDWLAPLVLYDYGARLYDPALGRFLSPDPEDETPSPYMYVAGDPVNGVDPDGAWIKEIRRFVARGVDEVYFLNHRRQIVAAMPYGGDAAAHLRTLNRLWKERKGGKRKHFADWGRKKPKPFSVYTTGGVKKTDTEINVLVQSSLPSLKFNPMEHTWKRYGLTLFDADVTQFGKPYNKLVESDLVSLDSSSKSLAPSTAPVLQSRLGLTSAQRNVPSRSTQGYMANPPKQPTLIEQAPVSPPQMVRLRRPPKQVPLVYESPAWRKGPTKEQVTVIASDDFSPKKRALSEKYGNPYADPRSLGSSSSSSSTD